MIISPLNDVILYSLYTQEAVSAATDEERLVKIHNVIQQLPPPHYRSSLKLCVAPWWTKVEVYDIRRRSAGSTHLKLSMLFKPIFLLVSANLNKYQKFQSKHK